MAHASVFGSCLAGALGLALLSCSPADDPAPDIAVGNGWTRASAPGQTAAAVYLTIINQGEGADRLIGVEARPPTVGTLHSTSTAGGMARMRPLTGGLAIAPRSKVALKPGETHIMLTGIDRPLALGDTVDLALSFARSGTRAVTIRVVPAGDDGQASHGMSM